MAQYSLTLQNHGLGHHSFTFDLFIISDRSYTSGMVHNNIPHLPSLSLAQYSLTVQDRGLKHNLFIHTLLLLLFQSLPI